MNRICRTCKEEKALQENYYKSKKSPGGYHTKCKACCKPNGLKVGCKEIKHDDIIQIAKILKLG